MKVGRWHFTRPLYREQWHVERNTSNDFNLLSEILSKLQQQPLEEVLKCRAGTWNVKEVPQLV